MKKLLIISHNPISTQSNMGKTFLSLFSQFPKESLCQLYIYPTLPNEDRCSGYFRITDKQILNRILKGAKAGGPIAPEQIGAGQGIFEDVADEAIYRNRKNKSALRRLLRDSMWRLGRWYSRELEQWLDKEQPDSIFVAPGVAKFLYDIALTIARKRNIPIITYICDEYYFVKKPAWGLDRLRLRLLQAKIRKLLHSSAHLVVISQELKEAYAQEFGVETTVLMTGTAYPIAQQARPASNPQSICYFGNIRCNRYLSLAQIGHTLDAINRHRGTDYRLNIYSAEKNPDILRTFEGIQSVQLCGFVSGEAFDEAFRSADFLLHTEAFDEASMDFVQHSVSTKIADSLASGIPLLAYGPAQVSSMQHLLRHDCAITATSQDQLRTMLETAFEDEARRQQVASNALQTAKEYHDSRQVSLRLQEIIWGAERP